MIPLMYVATIAAAVTLCLRELTGVPKLRVSLAE